MSALRHGKGEAGVTILDVIVGFVLVALIMGVLAQSLLSGQAAISQGQAVGDVERSLQQVLAMVLTDLRQSRGNCTGVQGCVWTNDPAGGHLAQPYVGGYVQFTRSAGIDLSTELPLWVGPVEYAFQYAAAPGFDPAETSGAGADKNGNGKIELGRLVRYEGGRQIVVAENVLEGFSLTSPILGDIPAGTVAVLKVGCGRRLRDRTVHAVQVDEQVFLRN